jgi:hypothetical protein
MEIKPLFIISCPIDTYSGYGARSRDIAKALISYSKYDIKILPQRWGNTPWGFIEDHPEEWGFLTSHLLPPGNQLPSKPSVWAQISVPNEFQPIGDYNIGFTAGIETTVCDPKWIEGLNRMDLNFVSSEHSKKIFLNSRFEQRDSKSNTMVGEVTINKPIEVLLEGADLSTYLPKSSTFDLDSVEEDFAYLFMGHWMQGAIGEDRKNVGALIHYFLDTFKNKKKTPALILKTSGAGSSYMDRESILHKIDYIRKSIKDAKSLPNIYLLHGEFTDKEINELYNHKKIKAMVSLTKGEGFGRPLLEFSLTKKPIITTNWSGHLDFLGPEFTTLINGGLNQVHDSALVPNIILKESQWFTPNYYEFVHYLKDMFEDYKPYKEKAVRQAYKSKTEFSYGVMESKLHNFLENALPAPTTQIKLQLPNLKKLENVEG